MIRRDSAGSAGESGEKAPEQPARRVLGRGRGRQIDPEARSYVMARVSGLPRERDRLIEMLHRIQDAEGCIDAAAIVALADVLNLSQAEVFETATFYHHFDVVGEDEAPPPPLTVRVCDSLACELAGAGGLLAELAALNGARVRVQAVPCVGRCAQAPVAVVGAAPLAPATSAAVRAAVDIALPVLARREPGQSLADFLPRAPMPDAPGYRAARAAGAYASLRALADGRLGREQVIAAIDAAGLRGMGGAGFPTARKWRIVGAQPGPRLMVVNADEGEPGTFKDRHFLETEPHRVLEGMLVAAWVTGCDACYLYLRDEYAGVRDWLERELDALRADPPTRDIARIELRRGAGAYVCGEESALIESIEGRRGMPRLRPPYIAERGLFGRPTLAQNAETLRWVSLILERGPRAFAGHGRHGRTGLRAFSVSGRVREPGVKIAPAGITVRELIDEFCGGMSPGHALRAYLPGGASGGILPASLADLPLDFDVLQAHGCFIGSAAIIVLSDRDRVRDAVVNLMRFFRDESCGQCTPCRVGTHRAAELVRAPVWDASLLGDLGRVMADASICGLGQAAPNTWLSAVRYFPDEVGDAGIGAPATI